MERLSNSEQTDQNLAALLELEADSEKAQLARVHIFGGSNHPQRGELITEAWILRPPLAASKHQPDTPGYAFDSQGNIFAFNPRNDRLESAPACPPAGIPAHEVDEVWLDAAVEAAKDNLAANPADYATWSTTRQTSGLIPPAA